MNMKQTKRAQAALEFLTTYGWAFLVILIMIGALAYFGVLNPQNLVPDSCTVGDGFSCPEYQAFAGKTDGAIEFVLVNTLKDIEIVAIGNSVVTETSSTNCTTLEDTNGAIDTDDVFVYVGGTPNAVTANHKVNSGNKMSFSLDCVGGGLSDSDRFEGEVAFKYKEQGGTLLQTVVVGLSLKAK